MTNKNICKFSTPLISSSFWISRFILEANTEVMKWRTTLNENRVYLISKGEGSFTIISKELPFTLFLIRMFQRKAVSWYSDGQFRLSVLPFIPLVLRVAQLGFLYIGNKYQYVVRQILTIFHCVRELLFYQ